MDTAVILAAGEGKRFRESTGNNADIKILSHVLGLPIITRTILQLSMAGIKKVHIVLGYEHDLIESRIRDSLRCPEIKVARAVGVELPEISFTYNPDWADKRYGTNRSLLCVSHLLEKASDFIVCMGDHIFATAEPFYILQEDSICSSQEGIRFSCVVNVVSKKGPQNASKIWLYGHSVGYEQANCKPNANKFWYDTGVFLFIPAAIEAVKPDHSTLVCALQDIEDKQYLMGLSFEETTTAWSNINTISDLRAFEEDLVKSLNLENTLLDRPQKT